MTPPPIPGERQLIALEHWIENKGKAARQRRAQERRWRDIVFHLYEEDENELLDGYNGKVGLSLHNQRRR